MGPHSIFLAAYAAAGVPLADPPGSSVLGAAVAWLQAALLGTVATALAVLAVAAIGFMMLTGRVNVRPALTVVLGCFILFGAARIVAGLRASVGAGDKAADVAGPAAPPAPAAATPVAASPPLADPHAGASVPLE